jgi:hypothetical protein
MPERASLVLLMTFYMYPLHVSRGTTPLVVEHAPQQDSPSEQTSPRLDVSSL